MDFSASDIWVAVAGLWFLVLTARTWNFHQAVGLLRDVEVDASAYQPRVSLIIPACNEESTIGEAARSLLAMTYPALEFIFVNDRSTDGTRDVLERVVGQDPRAKIIDVHELPDRWLGKVHALHRGSEAATGDWFLFTDADVHYGEKSLQKAIAHVRKQGLDFLAVGPGFTCSSVMLRAILLQLFHLLGLGYSKKRFQSPHAPDAVGTGVFNLVSRSAFQKSKGFEELRMEVIDDAGLAWLIKKTGVKVDFLSGVGELSLEWYPSFQAFVRGVEKNSFAIFQYSFPAAVFSTIGAYIVFFAVFVMPLVFGGSNFYFSSLAIYMITSGFTAEKTLGLSPWLGFTLPFSFVVLPGIFLRTAILCMKRGGIYWRTTFYPLNVLRAGQRLKTLDFVFKKVR